MSFHLTNKAYEDLKSIAIYTGETWGKAQRTLYLKMMDEVFLTISESPGVGKKADEIRKGYFKYPAGKHLVFYRLIKKTDIQIVRILHQQMDVESYL